MLIPSRVFKAAAVAYDGADRLALCGVCFERRANGAATATATNGKELLHVAWCEPPAEDFPAVADGETVATEKGPGRRYVIPREDCAALAKLAPKKPTKPILGNVLLEETTANGTVRFRATDLDRWNARAVRPIDSEFPDYDVALRTRQRPAYTLRVDPHRLMNTLRTMCEIVGEKKGKAGVTIELRGPLHPVMLHMRDDGGEVETVGAVMPLRTDDKSEAESEKTGVLALWERLPDAARADVAAEIAKRVADE